jgi:hypothetical protein|tara:strand:- start:254 stop:439 length:186 start_codon:yes stop_codon:yes gene_type:complete
MTPFIKDLIQEIAFISKLSNEKRDRTMLDALAQLSPEDLVIYKDSLIQEFQVLNPNKHILY